MRPVSGQLRVSSLPSMHDNDALANGRGTSRAIEVEGRCQPHRDQSRTGSNEGRHRLHYIEDVVSKRFRREEGGDDHY